jgi:hypothetical protein
MPMWCVAPLVMNEGNSLGQGYNRPTSCIAKMAPHATLDVTHVIAREVLTMIQLIVEKVFVHDGSLL